MPKVFIVEVFPVAHEYLADRKDFRVQHDYQSD